MSSPSMAYWSGIRRRCPLFAPIVSTTQMFWPGALLSRPPVAGTSQRSIGLATFRKYQDPARDAASLTKGPGRRAVALTAGS